MPSPTDELIAIYKAAQMRLIDEITSAQVRGATGTAAYKRAILANVNEILAELQGQSAVWVAQNIPAEYRTGLEAANKAADAQYKAAGETPPTYPVEFASVHQEALRVLIDDTNRVFTELIQHTGRNIDDMIAEANRQAIAAKLSSGSTVKQAAAILQEMLVERGISAFEYKRGGQTVYMQLDRYAAMVARSTTAEVQNQASLKQSQEIAGDLVKMTTHSPTCPICYPLQGRVYSISGKNKDYPKLELAYSGGYANIHPNCRHRVNPYVPVLKSDEQIAADMEYSNRPLDVDEMSRAEQAIYQEQLDRYNKAQKANTVLRNNRDQYQRYLARLGKDDAPKSFAGFMRMKKADGESWQNLQAQYRAIGRNKVVNINGVNINKIANDIGIKKYVIGVTENDKVLAQYNKETGLITLSKNFAEKATEKELAGVLAHEYTHELFENVPVSKWQGVLQSKNNEFLEFLGDDLSYDERIRYEDNFRIYIAENKGVSPYSNIYWNDMTPFSIGEFELAVNETLAEVARLRAEGEYVVPMWSDIFDEVFR